jgi:hypothetical protein
MACEKCGQPDGTSCGCYLPAELRGFLADFQAAWKGIDETPPEAADEDLDPDGTYDTGELADEDVALDDDWPSPPPASSRHSNGWHPPPSHAPSNQPWSARSPGTSGRRHGPPPPPPALQAKTTHRVRDVAVGIAAVLVIVVVIAVVGGISHTPSSNATAAAAVKSAAAPRGYSTFVDQTTQFSLALPSAWPKATSATAGKLERGNTTLKKILGSALPSAQLKGVRLITVDPRSTSVPDYVSVVVRPVAGVSDNDLGSVASALPGQYKKLGATVLQTSIMQLAGHGALQAMIEFPYIDSHGARRVASQTQYIVAADNSIYILSVGGTSTALDAIVSTFRVG